MEYLCSQLCLVPIDQYVLQEVQNDFSRMANHFISYNDNYYIYNKNALPHASIERMNNSFPYPKFLHERYGENALTCIHQEGARALHEIIKKIDPMSNPSYDEIIEYIAFYVSSDVPFVSKV